MMRIYLIHGDCLQNIIEIKKYVDVGRLKSLISKDNLYLLKCVFLVREAYFFHNKI